MQGRDAGQWPRRRPPACRHRRSAPGAASPPPRDRAPTTWPGTRTTARRWSALTGGALSRRSTPSAGRYWPTTAARDRSQSTFAAAHPAELAVVGGEARLLAIAGQRVDRGAHVGECLLEGTPHVHLALMAARRLPNVPGCDPERSDATRVPVQPAGRQQARSERQAHRGRASEVAQLAVDLRADGVERIQVARGVEVEQLGDELVPAVEDGEAGSQLEVLRAVTDALGRADRDRVGSHGGGEARTLAKTARRVGRQRWRLRRAAGLAERSLSPSPGASSISVRPIGAGGSSSASSAIGTGARSPRSMPSLARSTSSTGATRSSGPPIDASHEAQR